MITNVEAVYTEFVENNLDKKYPFLDDAEIDIPDSFLADIKVMIGKEDHPGSLSYRYTTYVSMIQIYPDYIYLYIATDSDGPIAKSDPIPTKLTMADSIDDRTIVIRPIGTTVVNGTVVIGTCEHIARTPGVITCSGYLFPSNVFVFPSQIGGIRVGDTILTGDITLEAGDNIELSADADTNTITITTAEKEDEQTGSPASEVLRILVEKYGPPITSINGISPNSSGRFDILPTDCLMIETDSDNNFISLYNPCGSTCASETFMEDAYTRINDLNTNYSVLLEMYKSVSSALSQMGARVSAALEQRRDSIASNTTGN